MNIATRGIRTLHDHFGRGNSSNPQRILYRTRYRIDTRRILLCRLSITVTLNRLISDAIRVKVKDGLRHQRMINAMMFMIPVDKARTVTNVLNIKQLLTNLLSNFFRDRLRHILLDGNAQRRARYGGRWGCVPIRDYFLCSVGFGFCTVDVDYYVVDIYYNSGLSGHIRLHAGVIQWYARGA